MPEWKAADMPDQTGRTVVITGGNSGIGLDAGLAFARKGADLILACRNPDKAQAAVEHVRSEAEGAEVEAMQLDLADLASVRSFAEALLEQRQALHVLCNNAGVMALPYRKTSDGFEMQFGTNHLGHFALTGLLLPLLRSAEASRVVTVSSMAHRIGKMRFEDLAWEKGYSKWPAYGMSKLANLLFAFELQRRLDESGAGPISVACHPGYSNTNLQLAGPQMSGSRFMETASKWFGAAAAQSSHMGALPTVYAATAEGVQGGDYIGPNGFMETYGFPKKVGSSKAAQDTASAAKLWEMSEELTGVRYEL